jgi:hypothetical protein
MDADAKRRQIGLRPVGTLELQSEGRRSAGRLEGAEEAVASAVDLATAVRSRERADQVVMARDHRSRGVVAETRFEAGRLHQVGEDQRKQA